MPQIVKDLNILFKLNLIFLNVFTADEVHLLYRNSKKNNIANHLWFPRFHIIFFRFMYHLYQVVCLRGWNIPPLSRLLKSIGLVRSHFFSSNSKRYFHKQTKLCRNTYNLISNIVPSPLFWKSFLYKSEMGCQFRNISHSNIKTTLQNISNFGQSRG